MPAGKLNSDFANRGLGVGALVGVTARTRAGGTRESLPTLRQLWNRIRGLGSKPAHRVLDPSKAGLDRGYVLQRKGESAQIRLDLLARLSPGARIASAAGQGAGRLSQAGQGVSQEQIAPAGVVAGDPSLRGSVAPNHVGGVQGAEALADDAGAAAAPPLSLAERLELVRDLSSRLPGLKGLQADQARVRLLSERRLALDDIVSELTQSASPPAGERRSELTRSLLQLYLPASCEALLAGRPWSELDAQLPRPTQGRFAEQSGSVIRSSASGESDPSPSFDPLEDASMVGEAGSDRAGSTVAHASQGFGDRPLQSAEGAYRDRVDHRDDWPAVSVDPTGFLDSLGHYLEQLARAGQMSDRVLERIAERSVGVAPPGAWRQESQTGAPGAALLARRLEAADTIHAFRATLAPLADARFAEEFSSAQSRPLQGERVQMAHALGAAQAAGDSALIDELSRRIDAVDRQLKLLALQGYTQLVDSFFQGDAGFSMAALALKQRAVETLLPPADQADGLAWVDAQHALAQGRRALDGWQVSVKGNRWLFGAAGRSRKEAALVRGAGASTLIDERLLRAVTGRPDRARGPLSSGNGALAPVRIDGGDNTRAVALMIAHQMVLQRRVDQLGTRLQGSANPVRDEGATGAARVDLGGEQPPVAPKALALLFDDIDLSRLGVAESRIRLLRSDPEVADAQPTLHEIEQAAEALYRMGLDGADKVEVVNQLIQRAIDQVIRQSNASANAQDITGMMPIANARRLIDLGAQVSLPMLEASLAPGDLQPIADAAGPEARLKLADPAAFEQAGQTFIVQRNQMAARYQRLVKLDQAAALAKADLATLESSRRPDARNAAHLKAATAIDAFRELWRVIGDQRAMLSELESDTQSPEGLTEDDAASWRSVREGARDEQRVSIAQLETQLEQYAREIHAGRDTPLGRMLWPKGGAPRQPLSAEALSVLLNQRDAAAVQAGAAPGPSAAARAILTLATEASQRKVLVREIEARSAQLQQALANRLAAMGPDTAAALQSILRAVVAQHYLVHAQGDRHGAASGTQAAFLPIERQEEILAALSERGIDRSLLGPEIDDLLMREVTPATIQAWVSDASERQKSSALSESASSADKVAAERAVARDAIISAVRDMQFGERIKLTEKDAYTLSTGRVPIDPSGLRAELAASLSNRTLLDIKCKGEKFQIVIRAGRTLGGEAGLSWMPPIPGAGQLASLTAKVSGSRESAEGVAISFASRDDTVAFLEALYTRPRLDASDWAKASAIEFTTKKVSGVGVDAAASISSRNLGKALSKVNPELGEAMAATWSSSPGPVGKVQIGLDLSADLRFKLGAQWEDAGLVNNRKVVRKLATAFQMGLSVQAGLRLRHPTAMSLAGGALSPDSEAHQSAAQEGGSAGAGPVSEVQSGKEQSDALTLNKVLPPNAFNLVGWEKELAALNFQVELATEQIAADGQLDKAELEIFVPLMPGLTTQSLAKLVPGYSDKLSSLSDSQRQELDALLDRVDTEQGHGVLINMALKSARREALNAQFSSAKQSASLSPSVSDARTRAAAAYRDHQQRLAELKQQPEHFELSQVIVVASDMMFRTLNTNLVFAKYAHDSSAMNGRTVGRIALESAASDTAAVPSSPSVPVASPEPPPPGLDADNTLVRDVAEQRQQLRRYGTA